MRDYNQLLSSAYTLKSIIDFEAKTIEKHLNSVTKRLDHLKKDVYFYAGYVTLPNLVFMLLAFVFDAMASYPTAYNFVIGNLFTFILTCLNAIYLMTVPFILFYFLKALYLYNRNNPKKEVTVSLPPVCTSNFKKNEKRELPEPNLKTEKEKLTLVLSKYCFYMNQLDEVIYTLKDQQENANLGELQQILDRIVIYKQITPAVTLSHREKSLFRLISIVSGVIVSVISLSILREII